MNLDTFKTTLTGQNPPIGMGPALTALWWAGKGGWEQAHLLASSASGVAGARIRAYLHRLEGDGDQARYWYDRAGCNPSTSALADEWREIAGELLPTR